MNEDEIKFKSVEEIDAFIKAHYDPAVIFMNFERILQIHKVTKYKFAKDMNIARTTINNWKKNYPFTQSLLRICVYFGINVDELLSGNDPVFNASSTNTVLLQRFNALSKSNQALILNMIDALSASKKQ